MWDEPRGLAAGHDVPQLFVHRGRLLGLLTEAAHARLAPGANRLGQRLTSLLQTDTGVEARFALADGGVAVETADLLIGADGIYSPTRATLHPDEGPPRWSGLQMWRGAADWPAFLGGASLLILGGVEAKLVIYPIAPGTMPGRRLTNWVVIVRVAPDGSPSPARADWAREGTSPIWPRTWTCSIATKSTRQVLSRHRARSGNMRCSTATPLRTGAEVASRCWAMRRIRCIRLGANGATQAILDARALADALAGTSDIPEALARYQADRLPGTSAIVQANRRGGPEAVIDAVEGLAPDGFADVDAVLSRAERQAILQGYAQQVGMTTVAGAR